MKDLILGAVIGALALAVIRHEAALENHADVISSHLAEHADEDDEKDEDDDKSHHAGRLAGARRRVRTARRRRMGGSRYEPGRGEPLSDAWTDGDAFDAMRASAVAGLERDLSVKWDRDGGRAAGPKRKTTGLEWPIRRIEFPETAIRGDGEAGAVL